MTQGSKASWGWQNISWGRELIHLGTRWHVGDGHEIFCKEDRWMPEIFPSFPRAKQNHNPHIALVFNLFDPISRRWDIQTLNENFEPSMVKSILSIPINIRPKLDRIVWHFDKFGKNTMLNLDTSYKDTFNSIMKTLAKVARDLNLFTMPLILEKILESLFLPKSAFFYGNF